MIIFTIRKYERKSMKQYSTQLILTILLVPTMVSAMEPEVTIQQPIDNIVKKKKAELQALTQYAEFKANSEKIIALNDSLQKKAKVIDQVKQEIQQLESENKDAAQQKQTLENLRAECPPIQTQLKELENFSEQYYAFQSSYPNFDSEQFKERKTQLEAELTQVNLPMIVKKSTVEQGFFSRGWHWLASTRPARLFGWCKNLVWPNTKVMNKMKVRDEKIYQFQLPTALPESIATNAMTLRDLRNAAQKIEAASYARGTRLALLALGYGLFEAYRHNVLTQIPTLGGTAKAVALLAGGYVATMQLFPRIHNRWYNTSRININTLAGQYSHAVKATGLVTNKIAEDAGNQYVKRANIMDTVEPNKKIAAANKAKRDKIQAFFNGMVAAPRPAQS